MDLELKALSNSLDSPKRPLTAIIGGAKISTEIGFVEEHRKTRRQNDRWRGYGKYVSFCKGVSIGNSLVEKDLTNLVQTIERLATENSCEIILQNDALIATKLERAPIIKLLNWMISQTTL